MIEKEYLSKNHSKFLLKYHVIFVCKYRRKLLYGNVDTVMKNIFFDIANKADFKIEVMETDKDHIHLLVSSEPKLSPLQIVRKLKQESTIRIWKLFPELLRRWFYRERTFWTDGYFVSTIGNVSQEKIKYSASNKGDLRHPAFFIPEAKDLGDFKCELPLKCYYLPLPTHKILLNQKTRRMMTTTSLCFFRFQAATKQHRQPKYQK